MAAPLSGQRLILFERFGIVTFLARPAEIALVSVVARVTAVARARQRDFRHVLLVMAGGTYQPGMRTRKREARLLIVIEAPALPIIWCMAEGAIATECALMMVVAMAA
jgi:hypothetical protein